MSQAVGPTDRGRVVVRDLSVPALAPHDEPGRDAPDQPTELQTVVAAAIAAAHLLDLDPSTPPWLPPLPTAVSVADLRAAIGSSGPADADGAPLALVDDPVHQRRELFYWRHEELGHLGIAGGPRSGRSTALVTLALGIADTAAARDVHVHVLQGATGPCAELARLHCVGTVTDAGDPGLSTRLISRLLRLVDREETGPVRTVVLVDGWESLEESLSGIDHGAPVDDLHRLLRDGPAAGVRFAVTGGRAILSGRLPGLLEHRLVLPMPDPLDLTLAGVSPSLATTPRPPGRAVDLQTGRELQLALPGAGDPDGAVADAVARSTVRDGSSATGESCSSPAQRTSPWRITALPERVAVDAMPASTADLWLGLGGDDAAPVSLPLGRGRGRVLVAGPHRSGRSSALATIGEGLVGQGRHVATVCPRRSPLSSWTVAHGCLLLTQLDADELVAARRADPDLCVLIDDGELVDGSPVERALLEMARLVDTTDGVIVLAAELTRANGSFRGLVPEVSRDGVGVLLGAGSPADGDVLGVRLQPDTVRRAGRGHLVVDGRATALQMALLDLQPQLPAPSRDAPRARARAC